ncbi:MAG: tRNA pseudouridine(38-40) synthase TruA [Candidatus Puniceispirillaceae bacterium]
MTRRIFITIEYDGTPFVGWQRQVTGLSVQQVLEEAAAELTGNDVLVQGAGRTDSGVHATSQVAHLDVPDRFDANRVMEALNALTATHPVTIREAREVDGEAHARFSATGRRYLYRILPRRQPPALDRGRVWHHRGRLHGALMQQAADRLVGRHDFTSFRASQCQADSPVRTLDELRIEASGEELHIHAAARSFLHHQVRNIVGTLALVGAGKWTADDVADALAARDRAAAGPTAPPEGLYLTGVTYPSGT